VVGLLILGIVMVAGCRSAKERVSVAEVESSPTIQVSLEGEVTRVVEQIVEKTVVATAIPTPSSGQPKHLVICQSQEPDTLYLYGTDMLAARHVQHAIFTNYITQRSYDYQADGLEKLPSLDDGDAVITAVEVAAGETVLTADDVVKALEIGDRVLNADLEEVVFDGTPLLMEQMVVDFTMQPTVWSDGTPVRATDSIFAFDVARDPATGAAGYTAERTAGYEAIDDLTVRWTGVPGFRNQTYFAAFWRPLPQHILGDLSPARLLESDEAGRRPVGDGPFKVVQWVSGDFIRLERNAYYYRTGEGLPLVDSITFKFIPDAGQLLTQVIAGQCDIATHDGLTIDQASALLEAEAAGILVPFFQTGPVYEHIDFNIDPAEPYAETRYDWFDDVRVRQAMTLCTDRQTMVDTILYGRSEVMHTYVPTVHPLYPAEGVTAWPFDVAAGNALLDEAGYERRDAAGFRLDPSGARFAPRLGTTSGNATRRQIAYLFKDNMAACGIDVGLYFVPASEWFADGPEGELFGRQYDLGEFAWQAQYEPDCLLYHGRQVPGPADTVNPKTGEAYAGWDGLNNTGYVNAAFDEACDAARQQLPGLPEFAEWHKAAQIIFAQDVPVIPLFPLLKVAVTGPDVLGFRLDPTERSELSNVVEIDLQR
jgi:peptide/nickel transport system substrate-binding protein